MSERNKLIHETPHYAVQTHFSDANLDWPDGYAVVNLDTEVIEAIEKLLPQAILHAENSNSFIQNRLWRWVSEQGSKQAVELDKQEALVSFDPEPGLLD